MSYDSTRTIRSHQAGTTRRIAPATLRTHLLVFLEPDPALVAVRRLRASGYTVPDVHTPFPVHGMEEALGLRETRLPYATLVGGFLGATAAIALQVWTHTQSWPLDIGGKSNVAGPALVPVAFELTILLAAVATVGALLIGRGLLPRFGGGVPRTQPHPLVNDDRFVVLVEERDASFSMTRFRTLAVQLEPESVVEGWRVS